MFRRILTAALFLSPAAALAQPHVPGRGEHHFQDGIEAYGRRQFRIAAIEFRAAYELTNESMLLFNLGSALAADGQRDAAREALLQYLRALPDAPNRALVEARLRELGPAPSPAGTPPPPVAPPPVAPSPQAVPVARAPAPLPPSRPSSSPLPLVAALGGGLGVLSAAVGVGLYLDVDARFQTCVSNRCPEAERARGEDAAAVALLWGGGAVALAGLVTFLVAPRAGRSSPRAMVLPQPGGLVVAGTF